MNKDNTVRLTDSNFHKEVLESDIPVLVDFWASWCTPCKMSEPVMAQISRDYGEKIKIAKINVDQNPQISAKYSIMGVPTFIVFNLGNEVERKVGAQSKKQLDQMVNQLL